MEAGDLVRHYAARLGWPILKYNLMVEGEHDARYLNLASRLNREQTGLSLLGRQLSAFPPGRGDAGGTHGIQDQFPTLRNLIRNDLDANGERLFVAVALLDSDPAGKYACRALAGKHTAFSENRDVYLLHRRWPMTAREPSALSQQLEKANHPWRGLDCEIEDLLPVGIVQAFSRERPNRRPRRSNEVAGEYHWEFDAAAKAELVRYVEDYALLSDMVGYVGLLKAMRYYLELPPDGDP